MAKSKSPKLHLSLLTSLQICRPKNPCSMIKNPLPRPAPYILSPLNSKTFDISFPSTPIPPPSTPSSKVAPLDFRFPSSLASPRSDHDEPDWRVPSSTNDKKKHKNTKHKPKLPCNDFSSLSVHEEERGKHKPRRFKRYGSKEWKEGEECSERKPMLERSAPCMLERSFVVVKKSVDPYEDFKKSMSEMIVAKQILEPKELEHLLMSFLSLNSRMHHKVIIQAFTQIFKEAFCG